MPLCYECGQETAADDIPCLECYEKAWRSDTEAELMSRRPSAANADTEPPPSDVKQRLASAAKHLEPDDGPGIIHTVLFTLEAVPNPLRPDDREHDDYAPHVLIVDDDVDTIDGLMRRHYVLSDAMAAIHEAMDDTMVKVGAMLDIGPEPKADEELN